MKDHIEAAILDFEEILKFRVPSGHTVGQFIHGELVETIRTVLKDRLDMKGVQDGKDTVIGIPITEPMEPSNAEALAALDFLMETLCDTFEQRRYEENSPVGLAEKSIRAALQRNDVPQHSDDVAVDKFAAAMKAKLKKARDEKGRGGWETCSQEHLNQLLHGHLAKGDPVDVGNFAMMMHSLGMVTTSPVPQGFVLMPIELTEDMIKEAIKAYNSAPEDDWMNTKGIRAEYKAMIAAAPKPTGE